MTETPARLSAALADRYRIERELGQGGMATVYLADDLKHDRKVAIKVLRPELAAVIGAERFLSEIKTTANLQHPHILPLFDSGAAGGGAEGQSFLYYVMPFVEGESLRDRLNREKQLPIADAIRIASEVASALDYAHRRDVIHRDIKPENILLHDGRALVADFGIALAASRAGGTRMTETGMSLGTPHYMSPEQAMGEREITARSDVYALGCVLYEMLTGDPPFTGSTAQAIVARVVTETPRSLTAQRMTIPPHVEAAVFTALQKLPADRFASAAQFAEALARSDYVATGTWGRPAAALPVAPPTPRERLRRAAPWAVALAGLATSAWLWLHQPRPVPPPTERFTLTPGRNAAVADGTGMTIAFSPDGSRIVYLGQDSTGVRQLYLRGLDRVDPVLIPGTVGADQPFFSPDGQWLGFRQDGKLRKVALAGGAVVTICDASGALYGASWGAGDVIVFSQGGGLRRVSATGGEPAALAAPDTARNEAYRFPEVLPDGRAVLFTAVTDSGPTLRVVTLANTAVKPLGQAGMSPHFVEGGYLVYAESDGTLFAAPFDARRLRLTGPAQPITDNVRLGPAQVAKLGIARTGSIAYLSGSSARLVLALVDRAGRATPLPMAANWYTAPRFSPDGRRIAVTISVLGRTSAGFVPGDLWVWDLAAGNFQRITFDTASATGEWTADGRRLIYTHLPDHGRVGLYSIRTDGSGQPESLLVRPSPIYESALTPDGRHVVERETNLKTGRDIWLVPLDSLQAARPLLVTPFDERNLALSPDGRWLAYASNETGAFDVYVRGLAEGSGRTRVSASGGVEPRWAHSGRELFFRNGDSVYVVPVTTGAEFHAGPPHVQFGGSFVAGNPTNWDVAPDGQRFVMVRTPTGATEGGSLNLVLHWFDQLRAQRR